MLKYQAISDGQYKIENKVWQFVLYKVSEFSLLNSYFLLQWNTNTAKL